MTNRSQLVAPSSLDSAALTQAQHTPLQSAHFEIKVMIVNDEGEPEIHLSEFGSNVTAWAFRPLAAAEPENEGEDEPDDDDDEHFELGDEPSEDDESDDYDDEDEALLADDQPAELVLTHSVTGAAYRELARHVFSPDQELPLLVVTVTYYAPVSPRFTEGRVEQAEARCPIFSHIFFGYPFQESELFGSLSDGRPLELTLSLDVQGFRTFEEPLDERRVAALVQEVAAGTH